MTHSRSASPALDAETLLAHRPWLAHFSRALVADAADVDDVVQQTFTNALTRPPAHDSNLRGWLGTIARNIVRARSRSDRARVAREVALPPPPAVENPREAVERTELRRIVVEAVLALAEPYRSTVIFRFLEEQEVRDVARRMQTNEDTVRTRIRRGVARVREVLEQRVTEKARGSGQDATEALAGLFAGLQEIAASSGSHVVSHGIARAVGRHAVRSTTRRILVAAVTVAAAGGGFLWWKSASSPSPSGVDVATRDPASTALTPIPSSPPVDVVRTADASPSPPAPTPSATPPPSTPPVVPAAPEAPLVGTVRGLVRDPAGNPLGNAYVWAIAQPSAEASMLTPEFGTKAKEAADRYDDGKPTPNWYPVITEDDGTYEIRNLSKAIGWTVGAFDPDLGGVVGPPLEFDRDHDELDVDLKLVHGMAIRGFVKDESGKPVGNASVTLYSADGAKGVRTDVVTTPCGTDVGRFDAGFRCADKLEIEIEAPGFVRSARRTLEFAPGATSLNVKLTLNHRPGKVVRGRVVDPAGSPLVIFEMLANVLTATAPVARPNQIAVRAVPDGIAGRFDFDENRYEVVVPDGFRGSLELTIAGWPVGSAALADLAHPPDLPCDVRSIPADVAPTLFAVRFVDAETKKPVDCSKGPSLPRAFYAGETPARLRSQGSDEANGVFQFGCVPGDFTVEQLATGYAPGMFRVVVPPGGLHEPVTMELERARGGVRGRVLHPDGRPFANTVVFAYRVTASGPVDASGIGMATSTEGRFEFPNFSGGEHVIVASGGPDEASGFVRVVPKDPWAEVEIRCSTGSPVRFRIGAAPTPESAPNSRLRIVDASGVVVEETDHAWSPKKRSFDEFTAILRDGHYTVVIGRDGFESATREFDVPTREALDIPLTPLPRRSTPPRPR